MQKTIVQFSTSLGKKHHSEEMFKHKCLNANSDYVAK
jgi:hypothetical protein